MQDRIRKFLLVPTDNVVNQFTRYALTGGIASVADISLFNVCANLFRINHILSNTLSFSLGLTVNYLLSREWVFNKRTHNLKKDFLLFSVIGIIGLILGNILMFLLVDLGTLYLILGYAGDGLIKSAAKLLIMFPVLLWNFFARKTFVFST